MQKTVDDLKRKNNLLQKKLATDEDGLSVVSKDYEEVVKGTLSQVTPRESYDFYKNPESQNAKLQENSSGDVGEENEDEEEDQEEEEDNYSQESDKNSANSV